MASDAALGKKSSRYWKTVRTGAIQRNNQRKADKNKPKAGSKYDPNLAPF